jgi:hypothetical protein
VPSVNRERCKPTGEINRSAATATKTSLGPGVCGLSWCCKLLAPPPRDSSAAGAGPSWVGGTRGMPSGEIWGGDGPAAGALIGHTAAAAAAVEVT